jgi:hypothetical protein
VVVVSGDARQLADFLGEHTLQMVDPAFALKELASLRSSHQSHLVAVLRCAKWWLMAYE